MALDKNLFTLNLEPSKIEPTAIDLVDPSGVVHYRKRWIPNEAGTYLFSLIDPLSESVLSTAAAPAASSKEKVIELHNPSVIVPLAFKGTLTFKWSFVWEEHEFHWKRESCYMIRKPDPPVLVAVTKEPAGRIKTSTVQILDYNLNRFDIDDRKGLEIVLLTSLLTFGDYSDQQRSKSGDAPSLPNPSPATPVALPPPKPEGSTVDQIAILQAKEQRDVNEVVIGEAGSVDEYSKHCVTLLEDATLLYITLRSLSPECVSKVVQVAEATKRTCYKSGAYEEELHQYVDTSFDQPAASGKSKGKGPRVINLDDRHPSAPTPTHNPGYKPPSTLTIHLSKIAMPELQPKAKQAAGGSHTQGALDPKSNSSKHGKQPSPRSTTPSDPQPPSPSSQQQNGLRAKLTAFTSRASSPPPTSRPSSAPHPQPPSRPPHTHTQSHSQSHPRPAHSRGHPPPSPKSHPQRSHAQRSPVHLQPPHSHTVPGPLQPPFNPHRPAGPVPLHSQPPAPRPRPKSNIYTPQGPSGYVPFQPGPQHAPPNPAFALYPPYAVAPGPMPPAPQRGFLEKLVRR